MADLYSVLGVARGASEEDIRRAYRRLAKENHPDLNPGNKAAEARFKEITAAYDILGDEQKRARYDRGEIDDRGMERPERGFYREWGGTGPNTRYERRSAGPGTFEDLGDMFADLFGRGAARGRRPFEGPGGAEAAMHMRGADTRYKLSVDFLEAANGATRRVTMPDGKTLDITIPAGLADGQTLRLKGQGQPGPLGNSAGDALIEVSVRPHPLFEREGGDIRSVLPVTLSEALNGANVRAETVSGPVSVRVPKGSNSGEILRLRGKGVPASPGAARGDHLVELSVVLPKGGEPELARLVAEWEARHPYDPRGRQEAKA